MPTLRYPNCHHALAIVELEVSAVNTGPDLSSQPDTPLLLRISEAARLLGVSRTTMYGLVARGDVPIVRIGRSVRGNRAVVERMASRAAIYRWRNPTLTRGRWADRSSRGEDRIQLFGEVRLK